ncbi:MAG: SDR family NAD(P)-dependent oxidoreductase [Rhodospirillales bacterium]
MSQDNPAAIVTGSSSGMGAATALKLAALGWNVVLNASKSAKEAEAAAAKCRQAGGAQGARAIVAMGDVANDADCRRVAAACLEAFGRIDELVNSAATTKVVPAANLDGLSPEDFARILAVNVIGPFQMICACAPALRAARGAIVNISSNAALSGAGSSVAYSASKGALNTMTLSLARALAPEIRVNAVLPGYTHTPWQDRYLGPDNAARVAAHYRASAALKRDTTAEDVADAAVWLIEGAKSTTGQLVVVDAGNHLFVNAPPPGKA